MEYIFTESNLKLLDTYITPRTLLGFDFDGTLAPIVSNPSAAAMSKSISGLMMEINRKAPLAIITGRGVQDVKNFLPFIPKYLIGNHGLEVDRPSEDSNEIKLLIAEFQKDFRNKYEQELVSLGIELEDKFYSISFHYRNTKNILEAEKFLGKALKNHPSLKVSKGKMVFNVLPDNGVTKGQAFLNALKAEGADKGIYVGDDQTDEDVFIHSSPQIISIRVGETKISHAPFFLKKQNEVEKLLHLILNKLNESYT